MSDGDFRFRHVLLDLTGDIVDFLDVVEQVEHLSLPGQLALDDFLDQRPVFLNDIGLHRHPVARRCFQLGQGADADQRHLQGARNRRGGERKHVDGFLHFLDLFLMFNPEALFFVNDQQPEIVKLHVFGQNPVRADDHIDLSFLEFAQNFLLFGLHDKPVEDLDVNREVFKALHGRGGVLQGKDRGRAQKRDLLALGNRLERSPQRDLGLAKANVAAQQTIHRFGLHHVFFDLLHGQCLIGRQLVIEIVFKFLLERRIRPVGVADIFLALGIQLDQAVGNLVDIVFQALLGLFPIMAAQLIQFRHNPFTGDEFTHQTELFQRN